MLLVAGRALGLEPAHIGALSTALFVALGISLLFTLGEGALAPHGRVAEYERVIALVEHGPYARAHWLLGIGAGLLLPIALLVIGHEFTSIAAAALALLGLWIEKDILVRAGQALPIS